MVSNIVATCGSSFCVVNMLKNDTNQFIWFMLPLYNLHLLYVQKLHLGINDNYIFFYK